MQVRVAMAAQELLSCGEKWNQGCDGGFPFLASKYSPPRLLSWARFGLAQCSEARSVRLQAVCALVV